ncbi:MAG: MATE family efflux transporter [Clostridia bacterium]|nr:MATE family efflux transporter [Clostridia bacterium]
MKQTNSSFTRTMLSIAIPVALQNLLFSSFTLIDTLMIGALGDTPLAAVGMAGKWSWFFGIVLYGMTSGAGVFIAQYFGAGNHRGIHRTYGLVTMSALAASLLFMSAAIAVPEMIIRMFTTDAEAIAIGAVYLRIIALSYPFQALSKAGGTLLQSTQRVSIPFIGAAVSVATNVVFNALLIFGLCGFPALGAAGAAIASAIAAVVNTAVIFGLGFKRHTHMRAPIGEMLDISRSFALDYVRISTPALFNETIWALGNLGYNAVFGHISTEAYAAMTVVKSIEDLTTIAIWGMGSSCAVMIGSFIGQGDMERAKDCGRRHLALTAAFSVLVGVIVIALRSPILSLFGVSDTVRGLSAALLIIYALEAVPRNLPYMLVCGIFRSGGDTRYGLIVDMISMYLIGLPLTAFVGLCLHAGVPVTYLTMYLVEDVFKCFVYGRHFLSGRWIKPVARQADDA